MPAPACSLPRPSRSADPTAVEGDRNTLLGLRGVDNLLVTVGAEVQVASDISLSVRQRERMAQARARRLLRAEKPSRTGDLVFLATRGKGTMIGFRKLWN
jgi:hypothetical protein